MSGQATGMEHPLPHGQSPMPDDGDHDALVGSSPMERPSASVGQDDGVPSTHADSIDLDVPVMAGADHHDPSAAEARLPADETMAGTGPAQTATPAETDGSGVVPDADPHASSSVATPDQQEDETSGFGGALDPTKSANAGAAAAPSVTPETQPKDSQPSPHSEDEPTAALVATPIDPEPQVADRQPDMHPVDEPNAVLAPSPVDPQPHAAEWQLGQHPEDEPTTVLAFSAPVPEARAAAWQPGAHPEDEPTTVLASPVPAPEARAAAWQPGVHPEDEPTTVMALPAFDPAHPEDERTRLVATEPMRSPDFANADFPHEEPTTVLAAVEDPSPADSTAIVTAMPPTGEADAGQTWFDAQLAGFTAALAQDEQGRPRTVEARQMLGAAARDLIARTVMQSPRGAGQEWAADTVLQPDQLLANTYIVRSLIARGGIGEIYRTRHRDLRTEHAVKILLPRYALDPTLLTMMLEEARLLQCVRHEAVVGCQGLLRDADGRPLLIMDYVRGRTLSGRLRDGPLPPDEVMVLARRLAEGLAAIHAAGIVHQDMSPDNVMLSEDSVAAATIIDFGLARRTGFGSGAHRNLDFAGKFSWASPEQLAGSGQNAGKAVEVDARSDLYSLGLILMAASRGFRLDMGNDMESARAARRTVPSLVGIDERLAKLLHALLQPAKADRPAAATDIITMLTARKRSFWERLIGL